MNTFRPKPANIRVFAQVNKHQTLIDKRPRHLGIVIGDVGEVAKQYDIKFKDVDGGMVFAGTKGKIQIFVEKLHFSNVSYWEID